MTDCRRGCGRCCDPVMLSPSASQTVLEGLAFRRDELTGDLAFIRDHWRRRDGDDPGRMMLDDFPEGTAWDCDRYDRATGECLAHDDKPHVCAGFPWYGGEPHRDIWLDMTCTFHADLGRRVLPLVQITGGRQGKGT